MHRFFSGIPPPDSVSGWAMYKPNNAISILTMKASQRGVIPTGRSGCGDTRTSTVTRPHDKTMENDG